MIKLVYHFLRLQRSLMAAAMVLTAASIPATAANVATLSAGASVVYSSPLAHGATANSILNPQPGHILSFAPHPPGGSALVAIDLGKSYSIASISVKLPPHVSIDVFVMSSPPASNSSWAQAVGSMAPAAVISGSAPSTLTHISGEYVVFDFGDYHGYFASLVVSGTPVLSADPAVVSNTVGLKDIPGVNTTPLSEIPIASP
jgi:hypothetical protein